MSEKFLVLERSIRDDLETVEEIYALLAPAPLSGEESQEELIVLAYRLHALYTAVENIFRLGADPLRRKHPLHRAAGHDCRSLPSAAPAPANRSSPWRVSPPAGR